MTQTTDLECVDTQTASKILNIPINTLNMWRSQGKGPRYVKIESLVRYNLKDLENYIAEKKSI